MGCCLTAKIAQGECREKKSWKFLLTNRCFYYRRMIGEKHVPFGCFFHLFALKPFIFFDIEVYLFLLEIISFSHKILYILSS